MYIRTKTTPNSPRKSVQIVEGIRTGNKVRQKIVRHVGIAHDEAEEQKLKDYAQELIAKITRERLEASRQKSLLGHPSEKEILAHLKQKRGRKPRKRLEDILPTSQVSLDDITEKERLVEGIHEVGEAVYNILGYPKILRRKRDKKILWDLVLTRLAYPVSKHKTQAILSKKFGKHYQLDAMYRMMDKLYEKIDLVKALTFEKTKSLFPEKMDLVLFDVTTLYFESITTDDLRQYGYSKDHRFNTTQVVLALATNQDGLPIGYELFRGNKAEVKTLMESIRHWKTLFDIESVCFVGDRAMLSKANIELLESEGYHYIVAAKLKSMPVHLKTQILDAANYQPQLLKNELAWIGEFSYKNSRLIVSYKKRRAQKDQKDRDRIIEKIVKRLGKKGSTHKLITNAGVKKYTKTNEHAQTVLDEEKIAQDAEWDGLHGIVTNIPDDSPKSLIARYARLWIIEESFRVQKHFLKVRPIFHFKPERIQAHIALCYMSFAVLRHLQYRVNLTQKISHEKIMETLAEVQSSIYIHKRTKDLYRVPGHFSNTARKIYKTFNIRRSLNAEVYFP